MQKSGFLARFFQSFYKGFAILATISLLLIVLAGALVTKTGSGEGCGANWPKCHDQWIPDNPTIETVIEYSHRLITGVGGLIVLAFAILSIILYRKHKEVVLVAASTIFFIVLQSILGALAVLQIGRSSAVLALHFGFSLLSFASVFILTIYIFQLSKGKRLPISPATQNLKLGMIGLFVYTYIVVYLGAYVRHTGSSLGCPDWPLCQGQWIPELSGQVGIQFIHRLGALILVLLVGLFMYIASKEYKTDKIIYWNSIILFVLVLLQALSGGVLVLTELNMMPSLLHALIVSLYFAVLCFVALYVRRNK